MVAWVLGESSDFEEDELQRLVERWPEMRHFKSRLEAVNDLLEEALAPQESAEWRLSTKLRVKLLEALEFFSGAELARSEVLALPVAKEVPPPTKKRSGERRPRWQTARIPWGRVPWGRVAVLFVFLGILGVVVFSPTIFEEDDYVASKYRNLEHHEQWASDSPPDFLGRPVNPGPAEAEEPEEADRREGIRSRLDALDATMETFGPAEAEEGWERLPSDGQDILVPIPVSDAGSAGGGVALGGEQGNESESVEVYDNQFLTRSFDATAIAGDSNLRDYDRSRVQLGVQATFGDASLGVEAAKYAAGLDLPDSGVAGLYEQYRSAQRGISTMWASGVGRKHPQVEMANVNLKKLEEDLGDSVVVLQEVLQTQLSLVDGQLEKLKDVVEERRFDAVDKALQSQDYVEAKQDYESAKAMLQTMKITHSSKRIAKEVSTVYRERRQKDERKRAEDALNALDSEVRAQEDLVEEKRKLFHTIVKAVGIPYIEGMANSGIMGQSEEQILRVAQMQQFEREKEKRQLEIQLKTLLRLSGEDLAKYAASLNLAPPVTHRPAGKSRARRPVAVPELHASRGHVSTFSLHVSDVSFKLARAALQRGEWPDPKSIRVEEFVNAFDYGGIPPSMSERVGADVAQAVHPFMQQRNLLRISVRTAALGRLEGTPLRLTVLLDTSGSMERRDRAEAVRRAFALLATQLSEHDRVTLISFSRTPRLLADRVKGNEVGELVDLMADNRPGGGTNLEEALRLGLAKATEQWEEGAQNRVILLTDGAANLGDARPEDLSQLVAEMRAGRIAFDACGVGAAGLNDSILEALTRRGDGRYYMLDGPENADEGFVRQIAGALRPAAENVKVQVRFNPRRVDRYHLYGFEKHRLAEKDFHDDSVDAAEMAAEEEGTALYQFEPLPEGTGPVGTVAVRFRDTASGEMVEKTWVIPYRRQIPRLAEAGPEVRATVCAGLLGERLKGSPLGSTVTMSELERQVSELAQAYPLSAQVLALLEMTGKVRELEGE